MGLDIARSRELVQVLMRWQTDVEAVSATIRQAETLAGLSTSVGPALEQIGSDGRLMATAIQTAVEEATGFQIELTPMADPRLSLFLDLPVGSEYDPDLAAEAIARGETYRQAQIRREIVALLKRPIRELTFQDALAAALLRLEYEAIDPQNKGDLGGTLTTEVRSPFAAAGGDDLSLGLGVVTHALADTGDDSQIRVDEFQAIFHENGKVTLVLPGVIDLSSPHIGLDPTSRSARDVDQEALPSSFSSDVGDNEYAVLVREWVRQQVASGVIPRGAEVLIVGHSFGADTALDLASDPVFNGELVNVTHVVPAAYHSEPQLDDVVNGTQVGVVQNIYDIPVIVEGIPGELMDGDVLGATEGVGRVGVEAVEEAAGWGAHFVNGVSWVAEQGLEHGVGTFGVGIEVDIPEVPTEIEIIGDQVTVLDGQGFISEFEGGFEGVGHHQNNYIEYLDDPDLDPIVSDFVTDIGAAGYGGNGTSIAVDISIPVDPPSERDSGWLPFPLDLPFPLPSVPVAPLWPIVPPLPQSAPPTVDDTSHGDN